MMTSFRPSSKTGLLIGAAAAILTAIFWIPTDTWSVFFEGNGLTQIFEKGGLVMWPLLIVSILCSGAVIERISFILKEKEGRDPSGLDDFYAAIQDRKLHEAARISRDSEDFVLRYLGYGLTHRANSLEDALEFAKEQELRRYRSGISIIDTGITLAPLLGLLGTVTGMMNSFSLIGGDLNSPSAITGGIAEALIATAFGLGIAITGLIPFNILNSRSEGADLEMASAGAKLQLLLDSGPAK